MEQLRALQVADTTISSLHATLESSAYINSSNFCLHESLICLSASRTRDSRVAYIPIRTSTFMFPPLFATLLEYFHDHPMACHLGIRKTKGHLQKPVYWPGMRGNMKRYVLSCATCQFSKPINHKPGGFLQPVVASSHWEFAGVDFVGPLPKSSWGDEYILVFTDYFLKWVEICPVWKLLLMWLLTNSCLRSLPGMVRQNIWCRQSSVCQ